MTGGSGVVAVGWEARHQLQQEPVRPKYDKALL